MVVGSRAGEAAVRRVSEISPRRGPHANRVCAHETKRLLKSGKSRVLRSSDRELAVLIVRSILFNLLFYLNLIILLIVAVPSLLVPRRAIINMAKTWGRSSLWLLRVICGLKFEIRGREKMPAGPLIVA